MKYLLEWGLMVVFLVSLLVGGAACSHSHTDPGSSGTKESSTTKERKESGSNSGYGY